MSKPETPADFDQLGRARRYLDPYRERPGCLVGTIFGVPWTWLDRDDLIAVLSYMDAHPACRPCHHARVPDPPRLTLGRWLRGLVFGAD